MMSLLISIMIIIHSFTFDLNILSFDLDFEYNKNNNAYSSIAANFGVIKKISERFWIVFRESLTKKVKLRIINMSFYRDMKNFFI